MCWQELGDRELAHLLYGLRVGLWVCGVGPGLGLRGSWVGGVGARGSWVGLRLKLGGWRSGVDGCAFDGAHLHLLAVGAGFGTGRHLHTVALRGPMAVLERVARTGHSQWGSAGHNMGPSWCAGTPG